MIKLYKQVCIPFPKYSIIIPLSRVDKEIEGWPISYSYFDTNEYLDFHALVFDIIVEGNNEYELNVFYSMIKSAIEKHFDENVHVLAESKRKE